MIWQLLGLIVFIGFIIVFCLCIENSIQNDASFGKILFYALGLMLSILCAGGCLAKMADKSQRYDASKYRIETEITTRGEHSDTTYVIVRK